MTNFKDVTNMTQCKWLLSGSDRVKVETACKCQLALRNAKRKNAAIEAINVSNEADRAARQKRGEAIFNEFIEKLTTFQEGYIREMNSLRKVEAGGAICHAKLGVGGCGGFTGDNCATDCFSKDAGRNPKRCWSGRNEKCDLGIFGGETARCLVTYPEIMKVMTASRSNDFWKTAHTLVPEDGSLGKIEKMEFAFFAQDVKDPGTPSAGSSCNDDYRKPGGKILPEYFPPVPREKIAKDTESIACCTNIINDLGISGADVINQSITGCGASADVKEQAKQVEIKQTVDSLPINPLVSFVYGNPILASVSAGSVSLIVLTIISWILFRSAWIGLGVGSLFGITAGVAGFIILKRVIDDKNAKLLADSEKVKQAKAQSKAEYDQKIADIEAEVPEANSCDEECGENSVKEELGGNFTVGAGFNKRCMCECKKGDFSPGGLERPACSGLCADFDCPAGMERDFSKVNGTKEECCKARSCANFRACPTGKIKNFRANGSTESECCVKSCDDVSCPPEFPVKDPWMFLRRTDPVKEGETPDFCCKKGKCADVSCPPEFPVKNPSIVNYINSIEECCNR